MLLRPPVHYLSICWGSMCEVTILAHTKLFEPVESSAHDLAILMEFFLPFPSISSCSRSSELTRLPGCALCKTFYSTVLMLMLEKTARRGKGIHVASHEARIKKRKQEKRPSALRAYEHEVLQGKKNLARPPRQRRLWRIGTSVGPPQTLAYNRKCYKCGGPQKGNFFASMPIRS